MFSNQSKAGVSPGNQFGEIPGEDQVLAPLMSAYHQRGYEAGYARGKSEAMAAILEATEDFARLDPASAAATRRLLYAFSDFLEERIREGDRRWQQDFVDGLGI